MEIKIVTESGVLPEYETAGSAGLDIRAVLKSPIAISPGARALIPTGLYIQLPEGYEAQIRARSGLAVKHGIGLVNGVGTIDSDYRGEIKISLINWGDNDFIVNDGDRIAQMIVSKYERVNWLVSDTLESSDRGTGGFGHTGLE
jgi:dUTP pyrophosphatase